MKVIVLLNPTNVRGTKTAYTKFRKQLIKEGFLMAQAEVYLKTVSSRKAADRQIFKLAQIAPTTGTIIAYKLTETQYNNIAYLTGEKPLQERVIGPNKVKMKKVCFPFFYLNIKTCWLLSLLSQE